MWVILVIGREVFVMEGSGKILKTSPVFLFQT